MWLDRNLIRFSAAMSSAVTMLGVLLYGGYWLGDKLDAQWGTSPWVMAGLILVALAIGIAWLIYVAQRTKL